jgi:hypothetical protein
MQIFSRAQRFSFDSVPLTAFFERFYLVIEILYFDVELRFSGVC